MSNYHILLDLGGQYVRAVSHTESYAICELNLLATDEAKQIKASGNAAYRLAENGMSSITLSRPIKDGAIADSAGAVHLFKNILTKVCPERAFTKVYVHCVTPCGLSKRDKALIESVLNEVGVRQTDFLLMPLADGVKLLNEFDTQSAVVCNIGSDITEIATIMGEEVLNACTLFYGSRQIDREIVQLLLDKYGLRISMQDAEEIKLQCASLFPNDNSVCIVEGVNVQKGVSEEVSISARELYNTVCAVVKKLTQVVESMLNSFSDTVARNVKSNGVLLCGGGALLTGIDRYFIDVLKMNTRVASHPQEVSIKGAQILIKRRLVSAR